MEEVQTPLRFGAFDLMLLGVFFISYNVLGLMQIAFLYGRRYILFGIIVAASLALAQGFAFLDVDAFCREKPGVIVCSEDGAGLVGMGMVWVMVSGAMLAVFLCLQGLKRLRRRTG